MCLDPETPVLKKAIQKILDRCTVAFILELFKSLLRVQTSQDFFFPSAWDLPTTFQIPLRIKDPRERGKVGGLPKGFQRARH